MIPVAHAQIVTDNPATLDQLETVFANVVGVIVPFGAIVLFVMLLYGGIRYITSGASPQNVEQARKIITYAILGVVLLAMAFLILVIIQAVTGANVTTFEIRRF